jgi:uncharacterized membrane protein YoaK (UPF0700 family)
MFSGQNLSHYSPKNAAIWLSLAFQAGAINAGGFLACHRFVTHTTGFATLFGTELAYKNWFGAVGILSVPIFFLIGSMIAGYFVDHRLLEGKHPDYPVVLFLMTVFMMIVTVGGLMGAFGEFGEELALTRDYALLALLTMTCGIQNAMVTSVFGAVIRTTHLTGITTDLGIDLVRIMTGTYRHTKSDEIRATWMRIGIIASFVAGSFAAIVYVSAEYWGFAIPTLISLILFILSYIEKPRVRHAR